MKILQVNKFFYRKGGAEVYFFELSSLLEEHGHEIIPFSMETNSIYDTEFSDFFVSEIDISKPVLSFSGIKAIGRIIYSFEAKKRLEELIIKTKPDICHIHNIYHHISPSIFSVLKKHKIPVVMTIHDYKLICPNYKLFNKTHVCEKCFKHKYFQPIFQKCIKNSSLAGAVNSIEMYFHKLKKYYEKGVDVFVSPSEFVKNKMVEWGQEAEKIKVIPHFIDLKTYQPSYSNEDYFVYVARLSEEKGIDVLLNAMRLCSRKIKLKVIGDGPMMKEAKQMADELPNVEFWGYKGKEDLKQLVSKAKFLVVPSIWYEVFGMSIIEAFALGKPVIGSNMGAISELIKDNQTGLLFKSGDIKDLALKIESLYNNNTWIAEMGENARKLAEKEYNSQDHYNRIIGIYEALLREK